MTTVETYLPIPEDLVESFRRFTLADYHRLTEIGFLTEDDNVELLEGCLVKKMSQNPPHDSTLQRLLRKLWPLLPEGWDLRIQMAITLDRSEPEPDAAIIRERDYDTAHPTPADIACVAEVSDSSLGIDQSLKTQIYADAGIAVYLIVNLRERCAELHELPVGSGYSRITRFGETDTLLLPVAGRMVTLAVKELLPR